MKRTDRASYRETLLVIVLGFLVLHVITGRNWMLYTAVAAGVLGMLSPGLNRWIHAGWFFLGEKMGFVVSKVLLGAIFLVVLLPMGWLSRIFRKDTMHLKTPGEEGYHQRDHLYLPEDLENMW